VSVFTGVHREPEAQGAGVARSDMLPTQKITETLFGARLDPFNEQTRKHVTLIAFLAWVGLGADGLSSSRPCSALSVASLTAFAVLRPAWRGFREHLDQGVLVDS
jgi:hypothetical protein